MSWLRFNYKFTDRAKDCWVLWCCIIGEFVLLQWISGTWLVSPVRRSTLEMRRLRLRKVKWCLCQGTQVPDNMTLSSLFLPLDAITVCSTAQQVGTPLNPFLVRRLETHPKGDLWAGQGVARESREQWEQGAGGAPSRGPASGALYRQAQEMSLLPDVGPGKTTPACSADEPRIRRFPASPRASCQGPAFRWKRSE